MIISDIANHLNLHDLNITGKIADEVNPKEENEPQKDILLSDKCSERSGNVYQFCKVFGVDLNMESIGISENHVNILLGNIIGYMPTNIFFIVISVVAILYYIVQLVLQCYFFKPSETTSPAIVSIVLFFVGDALVFIAAIFFLCAFKSANEFMTTLMSLDTLVPRITYSLALSLEELTENGIPNGLSPIFQLITDLLTSTRYFLTTTINSFLTPTEIFLEKMVSIDESDLGVFPLYNQKIQPAANYFYERAANYPKLEDISKFFFKQNFTTYQQEIQNLYDSEVNFSRDLSQLDSLLAYIYSIIEPFEQIVLNVSNKTIPGSNMTVREGIQDLKTKSLESFDYLVDLRRKAKNKSTLWKFISSLFFIFGTIFVVTPILYGFVFFMKGKFSICIATTISICPLVSTILMFAVVFLSTGIGFALVAISNQLENRIDDFIADIIDITIPTGKIEFAPINITYHTNGTYTGVLKLTEIVFPKPFNNFRNFVAQNGNTGLASALGLPDFLDLSVYSDEIGDCVSSMGDNYSLPNKTQASLRTVKSTLSFFEFFPSKIDGLFNWGIPVLLTTDHLRTQIRERDSEALGELDGILAQIDEDAERMNEQFAVAIKQIVHEIPAAIENVSAIVAGYIQYVMEDLGEQSRKLLRNVYPMLDCVQSGLLTEPYAIVRNLIFYDMASACAYLSASGTLMIFGLVDVATLMWIRRKGMKPEDPNEGCFESICSGKKKKVSNSYVKNDRKSDNFDDRSISSDDLRDGKDDVADPNVVGEAALDDNQNYLIDPNNYDGVISGQTSNSGVIDPNNYDVTNGNLSFTIDINNYNNDIVSQNDTNPSFVMDPN